jgi:hypothetical protein
VKARDLLRRLLDLGVLERTGTRHADEIAQHWLGEWSAALPDSQPRRAWRLVRPLAALGDAVVYQGFLDRIEQSERIFHRDDVGQCLERAAALAATMSTTFSAFAWDRGPVGSDDNLRYSRAYVEQAVDMLSHDRSDYNGHRVAAMNDIQAARADLTTALRYDNNREDYTLPAVQLSGVANQDWKRGQYGSNQNLEYTRQYVEKAIDMLQHDRHDYDGYRAKAVGELQAAREQLLDGLQYR